MRQLIYGGTFDPPHIGHIALLHNAIDAVRPDAVTVIPAAVPPHKAGRHAPAYLRLAMCECFLPVFPGLVVSDIEIARGGKSFTADTLETLCQEDPAGELFLAVGGDMLLGFRSWARWRDVLRMVTLVVQIRGHVPEELAAAAAGLREDGGRVLLLDALTPLVSSTEIRAGIKAGKDMCALIPPPADAIVRENRLYQWGLT